MRLLATLALLLTPLTLQAACPEFKAISSTQTINMCQVTKALTNRNRVTLTLANGSSITIANTTWTALQQ